MPFSEHHKSERSPKLRRLTLVAFLSLTLVLSGCFNFSPATPETPVQTPGQPPALHDGNGEPYPGAKGPDLVRGVRFTWVDTTQVICGGQRDQIHQTLDGKYYQMGSPCDPTTPKEIPVSELETTDALIGFEAGIYQKQEVRK